MELKSTESPWFANWINALKMGSYIGVFLMSNDVYNIRWLTLLNSEKLLYPLDIPSKIVKASFIACIESSNYRLLFLKYPNSDSAVERIVLRCY